MKSVTAKLLILLMTLSVAILPAVAQDTGNSGITVEQVLDRYVEALGGREAIEKLDARACYGEVTTDLTSREDPVKEQCPFEIYSRLPDMCLRVMHCESGVERFGYDGGTGWQKIDNEVSECGQTGKSTLDWLVNPQNALVLQKYFPGLLYDGTETRDGRQVHVLLPDGSEPEQQALYFDASTGLLVAIGNYWSLDDYRKVDGVLFPHRVVTSRKGGSTIYVFNKVKHRVAIDPGIFVKPEK